MILIRPMLLEDLDQVAAIEAASFPTPWSKELFEAELKRDQARYFVSEESGQVTGYMGYWEVADEAHLINISVHPGYRRKGIGRALLNHAFSYATKKGARLATLEVRAGNEEAQRMYEAFGFRLVAIRKKYYSDNQEDAQVMLKELF